jgi:hypothetical protein
LRDEPELTTREAVLAIQALLIARATGSSDATLGQYEELRRRLLVDGQISQQLPSYVRTSRSLEQFWAFIRQTSGYQARREQIWADFAPALDRLEQSSPNDVAVSAALAIDSLEAVRTEWQRALDRRATDPEAAITAARSLLESTCKHVLHGLHEEYDDRDDLPKLYKRTAKALGLAPDQYAEEIFRQILGGCTSVVDGLGALRNRFGDAHGKGPKAVRPAPRHAELAVNLAGAVAVFLLDTYKTGMDESR